MNGIYRDRLEEPKNKKRAGGIRRENMPNVFFVQWRAVHQVGLI